MESYHAYPNPSTAQQGTDLTPQGHYHTAYKPPTTGPGATITETYHRGEILTLSFFDAFKGVKGVKGKGMGVKGKHGKGKAQEALAEEVKGKGVKGVKGCKGKGKGVKSKHIKGNVQVTLANLSEEDLEEEALAEEAPSERRRTGRRRRTWRRTWRRRPQTTRRRRRWRPQWPRAAGSVAMPRTPPRCQWPPPIPVASGGPPQRIVSPKGCVTRG